MTKSEEIIVELVSTGFFRVDEEGGIWRQEAFGRTGKRRKIVERRADELRKDGYSQVRVTIGGVDYCALSHRIVWISIHGAVPEGRELNHDNGQRSDNRPSNLMVVTPSGNVRHSWEKLGHQATVGEINGMAKLTAAQVAEIRSLYAAGGHSHRSLARKFGVSHNQIGLIIRRKRWSEFPA